MNANFFLVKYFFNFLSLNYFLKIKINDNWKEINKKIWWMSKNFSNNSVKFVYCFQDYMTFNVLVVF